MEPFAPEHANIKAHKKAVDQHMNKTLQSRMNCMNFEILFMGKLLSTLQLKSLDNCVVLYFAHLHIKQDLVICISADGK